MINQILDFFKKAVDSPDIRRKIVMTAAIVAFYRFIAHVPAAGIDRDTLRELFTGSAFLSLLDIFSGGTLANFSIMALGLSPYISVSIIMQMMTKVIPQLEELSKEGQYGQEKINQYTRLLTVPLAVLQSVAMYLFLRSQGVVVSVDLLNVAALIVTMTTGALLAVWLGELITEYGVTNGISFLIFTNIVAAIPITVSQQISVISQEDILKYLIFAAIAILIISLIIFITEATRRISVNYASRGRRAGVTSTYLPIRLNQVGVIPIIFAVSIVIAPSVLGQFLAGSPNIRVAQLATKLALSFNPQTFLYSAVYFLSVFGFTFIHTSFVFNPEDLADNLKKSGGYIPGIRPGSQTKEFLSKVINRITLVGAVFLGMIAVMPSVFQAILGVANLAIGGTGVLIVVSVVLEMTRDLESKLVMKRYDTFIRS
jgi:preprotein translocase subunit SecY